MNYLPEDLLSLILNIRTEEMKKDKIKKDQLKRYDTDYLTPEEYYEMRGNHGDPCEEDYIYYEPEWA